jgi:DNA-3-methyladenine glycosylase
MPDSDFNLSRSPHTAEPAAEAESETILNHAFFARETLTVARDLLGRHLQVFDPASDRYRGFRIVETEAYTQDDPACHAYGRCNGRAATLYKSPGLSYVYLIYGMYHCLNVVTEPEGTAGAVLFRALEPLFPVEGKLGTHGPGRLTKALGITKALHNELPMTSAESPLILTAGQPVAEERVVQTTRIGISVAADYPWRFYLRDNPWVSVREKGAAKSRRAMQQSP